MKSNLLKSNDGFHLKENYNKTNYSTAKFAIFISVLSALLFFGCTGQAMNSTDANSNIKNKNSQLGSDELMYSSIPTNLSVNSDVSVNLIHFHGNQQCYSCVLLGDLAQKVVDKNFKKEVESGRLKYMHINAQDPNNLQVAQDYQVTSISLQIGTYTNDGIKRENLIQVWNYVGDEVAFENYLTGILSKRLGGELN